MDRIDELLDLLNERLEERATQSLANTRETWERIGNKDKFEELGLNSSELEEFLRTWREENPYENI